MSMEFNIDEHLNDDWWFDYEEFYDFIANKNFKKLVEVGVWKGHSIIYLANRLLKLKNIDFDLYAVDIWEEADCMNFISYYKYSYEIFLENLKRNNLIDLIKILKTDSLKASSLFKKEEIDFVFIDANHNFINVINDIIHWFPKIKDKGIIAGHDYYEATADVSKVVDFLTKHKYFSNINITEGGVWWTVKNG